MERRRPFLIVLLSIIFLSASGWMVQPLNADEQDYYFRLKKSWQQMQSVFEKINLHYVEEIDPYPLVQAAIDGMLDKLDPYTVFIEEDGERRLRMITTGKYGGLGMEIGIKEDAVTVITPMDNSPAKRSGIMAGDIIREVDGTEVSGYSIDKVSDLLRGEIGSDVTLVIERPGTGKTIELNLTRAEIVIEDVGYAGFVSPGVAYIALEGFTDKAETEVRRAIRELRENGKLEKVILDLRGNPGGLLDAAVDIVNLFVPAGETVVYTKGFREGEIVFKTRKEPLLPDVPLAVLVDEGSASASEIVAGALQDMDRAVIIGEETFGKGLVQKVYNVDKNSDAKVKITTAKYYIPSGRSIQKKDYGMNNEVIVADSVELNAEEHAPYYTRNKRTVYDRGGIYPDIYMNGDSLGYVLIELMRSNMLFNFAVQYQQQKDNWDGEVSAGLYQEFLDFLEKQDFQFPIRGKDELNHLRSLASKNSHSVELKKALDEVEQLFYESRAQILQKQEQHIREALQLELAEKFFGSKGRKKFAIRSDNQVSRAVEVLQNSERYNKILAVN